MSQQEEDQSRYNRTLVVNPHWAKCMTNSYPRLLLTAQNLSLREGMIDSRNIRLNTANPPPPPFLRLSPTRWEVSRNFEIQIFRLQLRRLRKPFQLTFFIISHYNLVLVWAPKQTRNVFFQNPKEELSAQYSKETLESALIRLISAFPFFFSAFPRSQRGFWRQSSSVQPCTREDLFQSFFFFFFFL